MFKHHDVSGEDVAAGLSCLVVRRQLSVGGGWGREHYSALPSMHCQGILLFTIQSVCDLQTGNISVIITLHRDCHLFVIDSK